MVRTEVAVIPQVVPIAPVDCSEKLGVDPVIEQPAVPVAVTAKVISPPPEPPDVVSARAELNGFDGEDVIDSAACVDLTIVIVKPTLVTA